MKRASIFFLLCGVLGLALPVCSAQAQEEQQLIQVLQSTKSPQEKDAACARLKLIGTAQCVPAVALLLTDEQLSHSARYVLEPMSAPEAGQALRDALGKTTGLIKVGIINSLGFRREPEAVPLLAKLLADPDASVASAAASALGQIGGPEALDTLRGALAGGAGQVHSAIADATLRCANRLLATDGRAQALTVLRRLYDGEKDDHVRIAAYRGMILASSGAARLKLMTEAIVGSRGPGQTAALQLVREPELGSAQAQADPEATKAFADLLPRLAGSVQVALIGGLSQRGDAAAVPAIAALLRSPAPEVRIAAISALGFLGDASMAKPLAETAAAGDAAAQAAARQALAVLRRGPVTETLISELGNATPAIQSELAQALGERGDSAAIPQLLKLAQVSPDSARKAALQALALLADQPQVAAMVQLVIEAKSETARAQAAEALNSACQQIRAKRGRLDAAPLVKGLAESPIEARVALLPICSGSVDPRIRAALRSAVAETTTQVRVAAIRALCDTVDPELLPDLVKVACSAPEENLRTMAIDGCRRLTTQEESIRLPDTQRVEAFRAILATTLTAEQKRRVLAGLAEIPDVQALKLVEPLLADSAVRTEAAQAAAKIAPTLTDSQTTLAVLKKAIAASDNLPTRLAAEAALKQIQARADYLTAWQVAGPYRQAGKNYAALFDTVFPPEMANDQSVQWQALPACTDPKRPWSMDLLKALGGEQCVAYARTWVYSPAAQPARMEIGSDDGVKVWLNQQLVHANNTARPLQPGSDKADVTLNAGWNPLLFKVTQNNLGWEFSVRFTKPNGDRLEGIRSETKPASASKP